MDLPAIQAYKLSDAIEYTPGIRVESNCQNCNTTEVRMLGLPQQYLAILQDGVPNLTGLASIYGLEQIPTALIEQIEVVKGGGSTLYGPGAVGGVINLVSRTPTANGYRFDGAWNSMQGFNRAYRPNRDFTGVIDLVSPSTDFGVTLHGYHSYVNPVDVIGDGYSEISLRDLSLGGARAFWKAVPGGRLTLDYLTSHEFRRGGSMGPGELEAPPNTVGLAEQIQSARHVGTATWEHAPSMTWDYRFTLSVADTRRDSYYGGTGPLGGPADPDWNPMFPSQQNAPIDADGEPIGPYNVDWSPNLGFGNTVNQLVFIDGLVNVRALDPHVLSVGVQYRNESVEDLASFRRFSDRYENIGVLVQDEWEPSYHWTFVGGVRVDQHNLLNDPVVSPRASILWKPRDDFRMRSSVSTGFRGPELFDEDLHVGNVGGELQVVRRSPDLQEESSVSLSLGPEWDFHSHWSIDANLFHTWLSDTFFNALDADQDEPGIQKRTKVNAGGARVFGGEVNLVFRHADTFRFEIGYVEQRNRYDDPQLLLGDESGDDPVDNPILSRNFVRTPNRYAVARLFYDPGWAQFFAGGRLTGPMEVPHVVNDLTGGTNPLEGSYPGQPQLLENRLKTSPYFFTLDLSVSKTWKLGREGKSRDLTTTLGCKNVLNAFQDDLDRGKYRDAAYVYGPRFPRTLFATVAFRF
jgi:outer membrane receptor for ferrienterochelin and colicins